MPPAPQTRVQAPNTDTKCRAGRQLPGPRRPLGEAVYRIAGAAGGDDRGLVGRFVPGVDADPGADDRLRSQDRGHGPGVEPCAAVADLADGSLLGRTDLDDPGQALSDL